MPSKPVAERQALGALRELIQANDPKARTAAQEVVFSKDETPQLRADAVFLLGRAFPDAFAEMLPVLQDKAQPFEVRRAVLGSMKDNQYPGGIGACRAIVADRAEYRELRTKAYEALVGMLGPADGRATLLAAIRNPAEDERIRISLVYSLHPRHEDDARELLAQIVATPTESTELRAASLKKLGECDSIGNDLFLRFIRDEEDNFRLRSEAIWALSARPDAKGAAALVPLSRGDSLPPGLRYEVQAALAPHAADPEVRSIVIDLIVEQGDTRAAGGFRIADPTQWKDVARDLIEKLRRSAQTRSTINPGAILDTIRSAGQTDRLFGIDAADLAYVIIGSAVDEKQDRMTGILAELLVGACGRDVARAADLIQAYESRENLSPKQLEGLRVHVGGPDALKSVVQGLRDNLDMQFRGPMTQLNVATMDSWRRTIRWAQIGFTSRMIMSLVVFVVGIVLLVVSAHQFMSGGVVREKLFGASTSLVGGVGMMLAVVYSGPLTDIRGSVNDLAIASAAFIAYVHRVLEISHTFSLCLLKGGINFDEMAKSSHMISDAMKETIDCLEKPKPAPRRGKSGDHPRAPPGDPPAAAGLHPVVHDAATR
jgi:hypothetical protein